MGLACGLSFVIFNMIGNCCKECGIGATNGNVLLVLYQRMYLAAGPAVPLH